MRNTSLSLLAVAMVLLAAPAFSQNKEKPKPRKPTKYAVVKVEASYQVMPADKVADLKKSLANEYKEAQKAWTAAKKEAAKNKEKFMEPRPRKKRLKVVGASFPSEQAAQDHIAKLQEKEKKKRQGPTRKGRKGKSKKTGG